MPLRVAGSRRLWRGPPRCCIWGPSSTWAQTWVCPRFDKDLLKHSGKKRHSRKDPSYWRASCSPSPFMEVDVCCQVFQRPVGPKDHGLKTPGQNRSSNLPKGKRRSDQLLGMQWPKGRPFGGSKGGLSKMTGSPSGGRVNAIKASLKDSPTNTSARPQAES